RPVLRPPSPEIPEGQEPPVQARSGGPVQLFGEPRSERLFATWDPVQPVAEAETVLIERSPTSDEKADDGTDHAAGQSCEPPEDPGTGTAAVGSQREHDQQKPEPRAQQGADE